MLTLPLMALFACTPELPVGADSAVGADTGVVDTSDEPTDTAPTETCLLFRDQDEDTWGDPGLTTTVCDTPGFVDRDGDCDDQNPSIHPEGIEVCNQLDDDCDDTVDEGDVDLATWYQDLDGDGFGTDSATAESCAQPDGFSATDDDCHDGDESIHPYADELCDDVDQDCDDAVDEDALDPATWYADLDNDTFGDAAATTLACDPPPDHVDDATDCDDTDSGVNPAATETCDDRDQDCDSAVDEDPSDPATWYADTDGDGFGDAANTTVACDAPTDHVADGSDCDDGEGTVYPGASEICDQVDQDCDSTVDEGAQDTFYADSDGDGFGDPDTTTLACEAPTHYTSDDQDCDDADELVNPDASETCDDVDQDCDTAIDEDATDPTTWYDDDDGDGYGDPDHSTLACDAPSDTTIDDSDCDDSDGGVHPGAAEACDGTDQDCDGHTDEGVLTTYYWDDDGDGYGGSDKTTEDCSAPSGYVATSTDCYDQNADVNPGQTSWFEVERGDGSFDYDCDGAETGEDETISTCSLSTSTSPDADAECEGDDGWYIGPPICGDEWWWVSDCELSDYWTTCYPDTWDWIALGCR